MQQLDSQTATRKLHRHPIDYFRVALSALAFILQPVCSTGCSDASQAILTAASSVSHLVGFGMMSFTGWEHCGSIPPAPFLRTSILCPQGFLCTLHRQTPSPSSQPCLCLLLSPPQEALTGRLHLLTFYSVPCRCLSGQAVPPRLVVPPLDMSLFGWCPDGTARTPQLRLTEPGACLCIPAQLPGTWPQADRSKSIQTDI